MWGSSLVGDEYDLPVDISNIDSPLMKAIIKELGKHPHFNKKPEGLVSIVISLQGQKPKDKSDKKEDKLMTTKSALEFSSDGTGWFEDQLGKSADAIVKDLRRARRHYKDFKDDIDTIIRSVQDLKSLEVETTLKMYNWMDGRESTIRDLGLSDRNLKSLRKFGKSRAHSLVKACEQWDNATGVIKTLESVEDAWDDTQKQDWANAMQLRKDARKAWRHALHQTDSLTKHEQMWLDFAREDLAHRGPMKAADIVNNILTKGVDQNQFKSLTPKGLASLLNIYGEEVNIMKGGRRGEYILIKNDTLIIKSDQIWSYAAGFLDADGYISITKRGEPRAGFIATGSRGRIHCEQLHKTLGCGVLQLDQKIYKDGQRSQHRLQFYSKDDMRKLLDGVLPHLHMKDIQAKALLEFLDADAERKQQLQKVVQYENWKDTRKAQELLTEWGIQAEVIGKWSEALI